MAAVHAIKLRGRILLRHNEKTALSCAKARYRNREHAAASIDVMTLSVY